MHALGFYHEHQRPDRDNYVYFDEKNMTSNCHSAYKLINIKSNKRKSQRKYREKIKKVMLCFSFKFSSITV